MFKIYITTVSKTNTKLFVVFSWFSVKIRRQQQDTEYKLYYLKISI